MTVLDATLLFDSEQTRGQVGARSLVGSDRSLLFSAGPLVVDLVVYYGSGDISVVHGQVVLREHEAPVEGAEVRLGASGEPVRTDAFGQFHVSTTLPFSQTILTISTEHGDVRCTIPAGRGRGPSAEGVGA